MSKLNDLIQKLCPEGVEVRELGEICKSCKKCTLKQNQLVVNGKYPVINSGREYYGYYDSYNNDTDTFCIASRGEYAGFTTYMNELFWAGGLCYPYKSKDNKLIMSKFIYYYLKSIEYYTMKNLVTRGGIPALNKSDVDKILIPLPPLPVQAEIVRILDTFTALIDLLKAELKARKKQYEYYRDKLLSFGEEVPRKALKEISTIIKGITPIQKAIEGEYPLVVTTSQRKSCNTYQFTKPTVCIPLISSRGHGVASLNEIFYQEGKFALGNILCGVTPINNNILNAKFMYYYLLDKKDSLIVPLMRGGANVSLPLEFLKKIQIPIPPLSEQERIVSILDRFDTLCTDLCIGIPAEIQARQKQYEYYREQLLTFKIKD